MTPIELIELKMAMHHFNERRQLRIEIAERGIKSISEIGVSPDAKDIACKYLHRASNVFSDQTEDFSETHYMEMHALSGSLLTKNGLLTLNRQLTPFPADKSKIIPVMQGVLAEMYDAVKPFEQSFQLVAKALQKIDHEEHKDEDTEEGASSSYIPPSKL